MRPIMGPKTWTKVILICLAIALFGDYAVYSEYLTTRDLDRLLETLRNPPLYLAPPAPFPPLPDFGEHARFMVSIGLLVLYGSFLLATRMLFSNL